MEVLPAATLWVLAIVRIPAARDRQRAPLFRAAIMIGFWQFHVATIVAAVSDERRRHHLTRARVANVVGGTAVVIGFVTSNVPITSQGLPSSTATSQECRSSSGLARLSSFGYAQTLQ